MTNRERNNQERSPQKFNMRLAEIFLALPLADMKKTQNIESADGKTVIGTTYEATPSYMERLARPEEFQDLYDESDQTKFANAIGV